MIALGLVAYSSYTVAQRECIADNDTVRWLFGVSGCNLDVSKKEQT
jgi:hypothetical protein